MLPFFKKKQNVIRNADQILDAVSEGVFTFSESNKITYANLTLLQILGLSKVETFGRDVDEIVKISDGKDNIVRSSEYKQKKIFMGMTLQHPKDPTHNHYVKIKTSKVGNDYLVTLVDVTHEKKLEKSKDDFISVTSHELRTPLTIVKSYLWMIKSEKNGELNDKQRDYVNKAYVGSERMLNLINDTLNITRIEQEKEVFTPEEINLNTFLAELKDDYELKAEENKLEFIVETPKSARIVYVDKNKLREVLNNLVSNAFKFTRLGYIKVRVRDLGPDFVEVAVIDTGKGIAEEDLPRLFRKFGRLDNSYQTVAESGGTGLGLYIVKSIVEAMRGGIGVYSEGLGKGSTFWFTLPKKRF